MVKISPAKSLMNVYEQPGKVDVSTETLSFLTGFVHSDHQDGEVKAPLVGAGQRKQKKEANKFRYHEPPKTSNNKTDIQGEAPQVIS
jgi:hypothetical protein